MNRLPSIGLKLTTALAVSAIFAVPALAVPVVWAVNQQITAVPDGPNQMFDLDVDQDGTTDFTFRSIIGIVDQPDFASFADVKPPFAAINGLVIDSFTGDGFPTASRLQLGTVVSPASLFSGNNDLANLSSQFFPDPPTGNFQGQSGYVGFQFQNFGGIHYGFAQITVNDLFAAQDPLAVTIGAVGYESIAGLPVVVGVPEPATAVLTGLSAAGMLAVSRRRAVV